MLHLLLAAALAGQAAVAHMTFFHPSMFAWNAWPDYPQDPMIDRAEEDWWFRGYPNTAPATGGEVFDLPAGQRVKTVITCHFWWTEWYGGYEATSYGAMDACPSASDSGPWHANLEPPAAEPLVEGVSGCALAIADVDDVSKVTRENLAIFSVNSTCVFQRDTYFEVPAEMPPCTSGKCICAWFWLANYGQANFYMTGFECNVSGSPEGARLIGAAQEPNEDGTWPNGNSGPRQPFYAYNDNPNVKYVDNGNRIGYHSGWGWSNGAQNDIFTGELAGSAAVSSASAIPSILSSASSIMSSSSHPAQSSAASHWASGQTTSSTPSSKASSRVPSSSIDGSSTRRASSTSSKAQAVTTTTTRSSDTAKASSKTSSYTSSSKAAPSQTAKTSQSPSSTTKAAKSAANTTTSSHASSSSLPKSSQASSAPAHNFKQQSKTSSSSTSRSTKSPQNTSTSQPAKVTSTATTSKATALAQKTSSTSTKKAGKTTSTKPTQKAAQTTTSAKGTNGGVTTSSSTSSSSSPSSSISSTSSSTSVAAGGKVQTVYRTIYRTTTMISTVTAAATPTATKANSGRNGNGHRNKRDLEDEEELSQPFEYTVSLGEDIDSEQSDLVARMAWGGAVHPGEAIADEWA